MAAKDDMRAESYLQSFAKLLSQVFFLYQNLAFGLIFRFQYVHQVLASNRNRTASAFPRSAAIARALRPVNSTWSWPCRIIKHISVDYYRCRMMLV